MKLNKQEIIEKLKGLKNWEYRENSLCISYKFSDFKEAFAMMTRIAFEVEKFDHHPDWSNTYNRLEISLTTHEEGGVTELDFDLAKAIDKVVNNI